MCSWTNYILGTDRHLLQNVAVQDAGHKTYHYVVMGYLRGSVTSTHSHYLRKQNRIPLKSPKTPGGVNDLFVEL